MFPGSSSRSPWRVAAVDARTSPFGRGKVLRLQIEQGIRCIAQSQLKVLKAIDVPSAGLVALGNEGKLLSAAFLVVDVRRSSDIVETHWLETAAKTMKLFLTAMTKICRHNHGEIRSFNGDSILSVFPHRSLPPRTPAGGAVACGNAVRAAMQMKHCVLSMIRPVLGIRIDFGVGIDFGEVLVVCAGIRGRDNNDLVWVGRAPNRATKLADQGREPNHVFISDDVYRLLPPDMWSLDGRNPSWVSLPFNYAGQKSQAVTTRWALDFTGVPVRPIDS